MPTSLAYIIGYTRIKVSNRSGGVKTPGSTTGSA